MFGISFISVITLLKNLFTNFILLTYFFFILGCMFTFPNGFYLQTMMSGFEINFFCQK